MFTVAKPKTAFVLALASILVCAVLTAFTVFKLYESERWLRHTYQVLLELGQLQSNLAKIGRERRAILEKNTQQHLTDYREARRDIETGLTDLKVLIADNPEQMEKYAALVSSVERRVDVAEQSIQVGGLPNSPEQDRFTTATVNSAFETAAIMDQMERAEERLLNARKTITTSLFAVILVILSASFAVSLYLLTTYFRVFARELAQRRAAEKNAQSLSAALIRAQDEERRRISRELHDSLGQTLAGATILTGQISRKPDDAQISQLNSVLKDAVKQTRTLSYLMHPPMLEEVGFVSAARWFTETLSERSGIRITCDCPENMAKLPGDIELVLYRIMQETLTNVHKHAHASQASVKLSVAGNIATLEIRDNGIGMDAQRLRAFRQDGSGVGVGLGGIRQRVIEHGGQLKIESNNGRGTLVQVSFDLKLTPAVQ